MLLFFREFKNMTAKHKKTQSIILLPLRRLTQLAFPHGDEHREN